MSEPRPRTHTELEHPCSECGHEGPHPIVALDQAGNATVECVGCYAEFDVAPPDRLSKACLACGAEPDQHPNPDCKEYL